MSLLRTFRPCSIPIFMQSPRLLGRLSSWLATSSTLRLGCRPWPEPQFASESGSWRYGAAGGFPPPPGDGVRWDAPIARAAVVFCRLEDRHPSGPAVRLDNRVLHPTGHRAAGG